MKTAQGKLDHAPHCPVCKKLLDGFTGVSEKDARPRPGDVTVCVYCSAVLQFDDDLSYREADADTIAQIDFTELGLAQKVAKRFQNRPVFFQVCIEIQGKIILLTPLAPGASGSISDHGDGSLLVFVADEDRPGGKVWRNVSEHRVERGFVRIVDAAECSVLLAEFDAHKPARVPFQSSYGPAVLCIALAPA